jgi:2-C-methyl-D-erythritol 4-phosphate cytidylyltransferase
MLSRRATVIAPARAAPESARRVARTRARRGANVRTRAASEVTQDVADGAVSFVLLAGGVGKRMGADMPKQYLPLMGTPIALWSLRKFAKMAEVGEIVVVCDPSYDDVFQSEAIDKPLVFARPGKERQDSVYNGMQAARAGAELLAIHDSARPLCAATDARRCFNDAKKYGAAVLAVQSKATIKEVNEDLSIDKGLDRSRLWEMQTPQVMRPELLRAGYDLVNSKGLEVTDDVSIVEALGERVQVTPGSYFNLKVTTPEDMFIAERLMTEQGDAVA